MQILFNQRRLSTSLNQIPVFVCSTCCLCAYLSGTLTIGKIMNFVHLTFVGIKDGTVICKSLQS